MCTHKVDTIALQKGDAWGQRAAQAFSSVQGRNFRHEKTKKKRGSYAGGTIDCSVNSIKFDDSD